MFPDIFDRIVDVDDEENFDEYTIEHHRINSEEFESNCLTTDSKIWRIFHDRKICFESY